MKRDREGSSEDPSREDPEVVEVEVERAVGAGAAARVLGGRTMTCIAAALWGDARGIACVRLAAVRFLVQREFDVAPCTNSFQRG